MSIVEAFSLLGGVGLFLFGMTIMSAGLKNACGDKLQTILEHATKNKLIAIIVGLGMTVLVQSSSATDVMVIGFVNSGLMNLGQAIGVIMGANIGTTITAQITAFNISTFTPLLLFAGAIMYLFMKNNFVKHVGSVIMGFGMLFQGITMMKVAIQPLSQSEGFVSFLSTLNNPALAILFGIAFTALLQSSSSSTVIFQAFAIQGLLSYNVAVYLVIGAVSQFTGAVTAAGRVNPAKVYVIGVGVAGLAAIGTAGSMGAEVFATDVRSDVADQVQSLGATFVEIPVSQESTDGYARELDKDDQARTQEVYMHQASKSDIVITTAQVPGHPAPLLLTEECTRTVYAVQLLPPFVWEDPLPPLPDAPAALSLTLTMRDVEEIDACPAALGHRLACDKAGKRWLHHPRAETYLSERVALFQQLYR
mgnify:CR=1 FL=1